MSTTTAPPSPPSETDVDQVEKKPWYRRWWALLLVLPAVVLAFIGVLVFFLVFASVPLPEDVGARATVLVDREGNEIGTLNAEAARKDIDLAGLPEHVPQAVMAAEDTGFYDHSGISPTGIVRAVFANVKSGQIEQGGSTITQQYVKNALVGNDRTFTRKVKEAALAIKMEQRFDKDRILEMYLNTIYWGRGAFGVEAAALTYFGKGSAELDLNEAATLAGIIRAPEALDPLENPDGADQRREAVLAQMLEQGWIDQSTHDATVGAGVPTTTERAVADVGPNAYYLQAVRKQLAQILGDDAEIYRGLRVTVEMDPKMQALAQQAVATHTEGQTFSGAIVSIDPRDGGVRALVGGPDFAKQQLNVAVRSPNAPGRQAGSSFKPFTLAAYIEAGNSPESRFPAPASIDVPSGGGDGTVEVFNYGKSGFGEMSVREATWSSVNTVYMQMVLETGADHVVELSERLGIPEEAELPEQPSIALGTGSVAPIEMAAAYAPFANGGLRIEPRLVSRVEDSEGEVLHEAGVVQAEAMQENDAWIVTDVLRGVISNGTGTGAALDRPAAGKTGTTDDYKDAWFVGYVPQLVTSVWVGNLDNTPMADVTGGSVPATMWQEYMTQALEGIPAEDFPKPDLSDKGAQNIPPPAPSPSLSPSPGAIECVDGSVPDPEAELPCPTESPTESDPSEEPSPTKSPSPEGGEEPSPTPTKTKKEPSPEPSPTSEPSPSPSPEPEPSPTATSTGAGQEEPEPSPSPTSGTQSEPSPSPSP